MILSGLMCGGAALLAADISAKVGTDGILVILLSAMIGGTAYLASLMFMQKNGGHSR